MSMSTALAVLPAPSVSAAQTNFIPGGNTFEWVSAGKIHTKPYTVIDFVDGNTGDTNYTFIGQVSDSTATVYKNRCTNYNGDKGSIVKIVAKDKTSGTLTAMNYPDLDVDKQDCKINTRTIGFREQQNAPAFAATSPFSASAPSGASWVNDATLNVVQVPLAPQRYVDGNPNDNNRTFKGPPFAHCSNNAVNTIVLSTPTQGKVYYVTSAPPAGGGQTNCAVAVADIAIGNPAGGGNYAQPCGGTPAQEDACIASRVNGNANWTRTCANVDPAGAPQGSLCSPTGSNSPPPPFGPGGDNGSDPDGKDADPCDSLGDFSFRWIACPVLTTIMGFAESIDEMIADALNYDLRIFDRGTDAGKNFYTAWGTFRTIALALVLIAGLIMVVSQGTGMQLFDAYTVRKVLPRLLIAVIGIVLSWAILAFVITFVNDMGHWIQTIILLPFQNAAGDTSSSGGATVAGVLGLQAILGTAFLGATAYLIRLGPWGILSLIGTICLALLVVFIILSIRNVIITVCVLFAPLAIACYILPSTKKVYEFWENALQTMLVVFPIIMALLAAGKAMSLVTENGFMKILFFIAPYFFIPFAFKLAGGLMATVFSMVNDRNKGGFDRLSKFRGDISKKRSDEAAMGLGTNALDKFGGGSMIRRYRASQMAGGSAFGARYRAASRKMMGDNTHKMLEQDHGRAAGDDEATALAIQKGMDSKQFIQSMMNNGVSRKDAEDRLATLESGFGARLGSDAMRVAAFKARARSSTGYKPGDYESMFNDASGLINDGLLNSSDATAAFKENKVRADISGIGFGTWISQLDQARSRYGNGQPLVNASLGTALRREALEGSQPGMIVGGRHEAVTALAPQMLTDLDEVMRSGDDVALGRKLAEIAGRYDAMSQVSPKNAGIMADQVMSNTLISASGDARFQYQDQATGKMMTMNVTQMIESFRSNPDFLNMRREYASAGMAGIAQGQGQVAQALQGQQGPGGPGGPPGAPGP